MASTTTLPTNNPGWGFFGTIERGPKFDPREAWDEASRQIAEATGADDPNAYGPEGGRGFLDSRMGRHFADTVLTNAARYRQPLDAAIGQAIAEWQARGTSRQDERDYGIPAGAPQITGWVQHFAIEAEMSDDGDAVGRMMGRNA